MKRRRKDRELLEQLKQQEDTDIQAHLDNISLFFSELNNNSDVRSKITNIAYRAYRLIIKDFYNKNRNVFINFKYEIVPIMELGNPPFMIFKFDDKQGNNYDFCVMITESNTVYYVCDVIERNTKRSKASVHYNEQKLPIEFLKFIEDNVRDNPILVRINKIKMMLKY